MKKEQLTFNEVKARYLKRLEQFVPIVDRVHSGNHPEFHDVHELFNTIVKKSEDTNIKKPNLDEEFVKLREITNNYKVPSDVCESYEAVYNMLAALDNAYEN